MKIILYRFFLLILCNKLIQEEGNFSFFLEVVFFCKFFFIIKCCHNPVLLVWDSEWDSSYGTPDCRRVIVVFRM